MFQFSGFQVKGVVQLHNYKCEGHPLRPNLLPIGCVSPVHSPRSGPVGRWTPRSARSRWRNRPAGGWSPWSWAWPAPRPGVDSWPGPPQRPGTPSPAGSSAPPSPSGLRALRQAGVTGVIGPFYSFCVWHSTSVCVWRSGDVESAQCGINRRDGFYFVRKRSCN